MSEHVNPLGHASVYPTTIDPAVLFPIVRAEARARLGVDATALPFHGADIWNAWELSWLDPRGKPCIAVAELWVPCASPRLVESKSLKLYLNGYAMTRFEDSHAVAVRIAADVSACVGGEVEVRLVEPSDFARLRTIDLAGESLDGQPLMVSDYAAPAPDHLRVHTGPRGRVVEEALTTRLFRSRCPVTGQPDWASIQIRYRGEPIDRAGLLRYLVSYREHPDFHEACVERIFIDVQQRCAPIELMVYARFLRRGGIDINPWRATPRFTATPANLRGTRQ